MGKSYKILSINAANIDGVLKVDVSRKNSSFFKSSMKDNLDLREVLEKCEVDSIDAIYNSDFLNAFVKVSFNDKFKYYRADDKNNIYLALGHYKNEIKDKADVDCIYYDSNNNVIGFIGDKAVNNPIEDLDKLGITYKNNVYKSKKIANKKDLRKDFYMNGFTVAYYDGDNKKDAIKYVRYKRSAAMAKKGDCLFIREDLYDHMMKWTKLFDEEQSEKIDTENDSRIKKQLTSWEAYIALSLSDLDGTINIPLKSILFVKDLKSYFEDECVVVKLENGSLVSKKEKTWIENTIWDGEGLLDESMFKGKYAYKSMLLLRNRFFKSCVFKTRLQKWFNDNDIKSINQLNGFTLAENVEDIKLVVTESSVKLLKFADKEEEILLRKKEALISRDRESNIISYNNPNSELLHFNFKTMNPIKYDPKFGKEPTTEEEVLEYIKGYWALYGDSTFGVVKCDKKTKFFKGKMVRTNYQLLNTLPLTEDEIKELYSDAIEYYNNVADHVSCLRYHTGILTNNLSSFDEDELENFNTFKFDLLHNLLKISDSIQKTKLYSKYRSEQLESLRERMGDSKILVNGTYATLFSNGYELLQYVIDKKINCVNDFKDRALSNGEIMCTHFEEGEKLLCERNPNITMGNLYSVKNKYSNEINKYFMLSDEIVCVNSINENLMQRLNGADFDSDTMLITNNKILVNALNRTYNRFKVPVLKIDSVDASEKPLWEIDEAICDNQTGNIVNKSQVLNSIYWDIYSHDDDDSRLEELYNQICKLAIMSNIEIDKAKRHYDVDINKEIKAISDYVKGNFKNEIAYSSKPVFMTGSFSLKETNTLYFNTPCDYVWKHLRTVLKSSRGAGQLKMVNYLKDKTLANDKLDEKLKESINMIVAHLGEVKVSFTNKKPNDSDERINQRNKELLDEKYNEIQEDLLIVLQNKAIIYVFQELEDKLQKSDLSSSTKSNDPVELGYLLYFIYKAQKLKDIFKDDSIKILKPNSNGDIKLYAERFKEKDELVN